MHGCMGEFVAGADEDVDVDDGVTPEVVVAGTKEKNTN